MENFNLRSPPGPGECRGTGRSSSQRAGLSLELRTAATSRAAAEGQLAPAAERTAPQAPRSHLQPSSGDPGPTPSRPWVRAPLNFPRSLSFLTFSNGNSFHQ